MYNENIASMTHWPSLWLANHISIANYTPLFENIFQMSELHMFGGRQSALQKVEVLWFFFKMCPKNWSDKYFSEKKMTALDRFEKVKSYFSASIFFLHVWGLQGCVSRAFCYPAFLVLYVFFLKWWNYFQFFMLYVWDAFIRTLKCHQRIPQAPVLLFEVKTALPDLLCVILLRVNVRVGQGLKKLRAWRV